MRCQRQVFANSIVKNTKPSAYNGLGLGATTRRPGKAETRSDVVITADVVLVFVTQTQIQGQVRAHLPVVLRIQAKVYLANRGQRLTRGNPELAWPIVLKVQKTVKVPDTIEVAHGNIFNFDITHALTNLQRMMPHGKAGVVLQLQFVLGI